MKRSLRVIAMDYLARREHTQAELRRKLLQKDFSADEIDQTLDRLVDEGLLSDRRFAINYIEQRARNGHGPIKVRHELRKYGVSDSLADELLDALEIDWDAIAERVLKKKFNGLPSNLQELAKQRRFMQQRGFEFLKSLTLD